jgi:membrane protease YdiL (CAAX protease family)
MAETLRDERSKPVASYSHTVALLGLMFVSLAVPFALQRHALNGAQQSAASIRPNLIPGFLMSLAFDWGIFFYAWIGVKQKGGSLATLSAGRWLRMSELLRDIGIAIPFWVVWELVAHGATMLLAPSPAKAADVWVTPRGIPEVGLWLAVSCSAGFCEEVIFRGYLLRQFGALTGSVWTGVLCQAAAFGAIHPFKGWKYVLVVSILGVLYGVLAVWRRDLKPGMLAHGLSDIWEGWLKHVVDFK